MALLVASPGWAADYVVNDEAELAAAIAAANGTPESDTITLGTNVTLASALPAITGGVTIDGGGYALSGSGADRIFLVDAAGQSVAIENFSSITGGLASGGGGGDGLGGGGLGAGGAIYINQGDVTLTDVSFTDNSATGGDGGAWSDGANSGGGGGLGGDGGDGGSSSGGMYGGGGGGGGFAGGGGGGGGTTSYTGYSYSQTDAGAGGSEMAPGGNGSVGGAGSGGFDGGSGGNGASYYDPGYTEYVYVPGYYSPGYCYYSFWGGSDCYSSYYSPGYTYSYYVPGTGYQASGGGGGGGGTGGGQGGDGYVSGYYQAGGAGGGGSGLSGSGGSGTPNGAGGDGTDGGGGAGGAGNYGSGGDGGLFGGGGGAYAGAGAGGFGGGGGGSMAGSGGAGGFGGGGGGSVYNSAGVGGAGAGSGSGGTNDGSAGGGGGAGLGGTVFVGSGGTLTIGGNVNFTGSDATGGGAGGSMATAGAGAGSDLFLLSGTTTNFSPGADNTIALTGTIGDDSSWTLDGTVGGAGSGSGATIAISGGGTVELSGTSTIAGGFTVDDATLHVTDTGLITAPGVAVELVGAGALLDNDGAIDGAWTPGVSSEPGDINATVLVSAPGEIDNSGTIYTGGGLNVAAVRADADLELVNSGTIGGGGSGVPAATGYGVLGTNSASILTIDNQTGGLIDGGDGGIVTLGAVDITNSGDISSANGAGISAGSGSVDNQSGGTIEGVTGVVFTGGGPFELISAGTIEGTGGTAIHAVGSGSIDLAEGSSTTGNIVTGDSGTVAASLGGTLDGSYLGGAGEDDVTLLTSFSATGALDGGDGEDSLTFGGVGSGSFDISGPSGFELFVVDVDGDWTFTGTDGSTADWTIAGGTARVGTGGINSAADVDVHAAGSLELTGALEVGSLAGEAGASVVLGGYMLTAGGNGASTEFAGAITGPDGGVTKSGTGTLTLSGANSYAGITSIQGGTLSLDNGEAITDGGSVDVAAGATLDLQDSETIGSLSGASGSFVTLNSATLTVGGNGDTTTFAGIISGSGGLSKEGVGTMTLSGTNSYTGATTVGGGTLQLGLSGALSDASDLSVHFGATLDLQGYDETVATAEIGGTLGGTGTLTAATYTLNGATIDANLGAGSLDNIGGTSVLNGMAGAATVLVSGGTLQLGASERLADSAGLTIDSGAVLDLQGFDETVGTAAINGTLGGTGTLTASTYALAGATIQANLGAGSLENTGGTSLLHGTAGAAAVLVSGGTLQLGASERLANSAGLTIHGGATLDLQGFEEAVGTADIQGTLGGTGTLTAAAYTLDGATIDADLGAGILNVEGGVSLLNGTSAATEVNLLSGTLRLGGDERLLAATDLSIGTGVTLDLQSFDQTVASAYIAGVLDGAGTLNAPSYTLEGATVDANLGSGILDVIGGVSVLNGTSGAAEVNLIEGTLRLGGDHRLLITTDLSVGSGFALDLQSYHQDAASAYVAGLLDGTGTLTAASYILEGATVNANLGQGQLDNVGGTTVLNGTAAADAILVSGGTLELGASDRLADAAGLVIADGAVLELKDFDETVGTANIAGTLAGTGTLTASAYGLSGATIDANLGAGALENIGATSVLSGAAAAETVLVSGGTLQLGADERLSDTLVLAINEAGTFDLAGHDETVGGLEGSGNVLLGEESDPGKLIILATSDSEFDGSIAGSGDVVKDGEAHFTLGGESSIDGTMTVRSGLLTVNGSLLADIVVEDGGMLGGNGTIGSLNVFGDLSPGNSIGRITVNGDLSLGAGSIYTVEANPMLESDRTDVTGALTISPDAEVKVIAADGDYQPSSTYRILTADGGVSGEFASVEDNLAFLDPSLVYSSQAVDLLLLRNDVDFSQYAATPNQVSAAGSVQELGAGSPLFDAVVKLSGSEAPDAFMQLSGEAYASVLSGMTQSSLQIREKMLAQKVEGEGLQLWGDLVGTWGRIEGRQGVAKSKSMNRYVIAGLDFRNNGFRIGIAGGLNGGDFNSRRLRSSSELDSQFLGMTGGVRRGRVEVEAGAEWTWHDVSTTRSLAFGGLNEIVKGSFSGDTQQLFADASIDLSSGPMRVQPFGRLARVITKVDGFDESGGDAALSVDGGRQNVRLGTLGVRLSGDLASLGGTFSPNVQLGWQHGWGDLSAYSTARFAAGHGFLFQGAQLAKDAADIHAGIDWKKGSFELGVSYTGFLSSHWVEHGVAFKIGIDF